MLQKKIAGKNHKTKLISYFTKNNILEIKLLVKSFDIMNTSEINTSLEALFIEEAKKTSINKVIIDFANLDSIHSSSIGTIISIKNRLDKCHIEFEIINIQPSIKKVFGWLKLLEYFGLEESNVLYMNKYKEKKALQDTFAAPEALYV